MASNDPIASQARKPALSVEDAERFASQIRPSWELLGPDAAAASFGQDDAPGVAAPPAGSAVRAPDTIIDGVPMVAVAGSNEAMPADASWDAATAPPIEARVIASIGIPSAAEVSAAELPLPPQVGHPRVPTSGKPVAPSPPAKTKLGMGGGTSGERAPIAKPTPTRAPASAPAAPAPVSAKAAVAPTAGKSSVSKSRPDTTSAKAAYVPTSGEADDDIAIPISGAPQGLLLKIGGGVAALAVIVIAVKVFSGSSPPTPVKPTTVTTATAAAVTAPPPPDPALVDPPKATAVAPTPPAAPTVVATAAPTAKEKPVVAKVEVPTPIPTVKKPAVVAGPVGGSTPPAPTAKKKPGGIIRETPF